ncbi:hypothetical protein D3C76_1753300 [compost metagenome]
MRNMLLIIHTKVTTMFSGISLRTRKGWRNFSLVRVRAARKQISSRLTTGSGSMIQIYSATTFQAAGKPTK